MPPATSLRRRGARPASSWRAIAQSESGALLRGRRRGFDRTFFHCGRGYGDLRKSRLRFGRSRRRCGQQTSRLRDKRPIRP